MEGHLKIIVLNELAKKPMSGYSLMKKIEMSTGCWKPSSGSMYPLLNSLLKLKILGVREEKNKKVYFLTAEGKKYLSGMKNKRKELVNDLLAKLHMCEELPKEEAVSVFTELLSKTEKTAFPSNFAGGITPEVMGLKKEMLRILSENKLEKNTIKIKKILEDTTEKLKKL
jgi:DNA-binding PadR family transcriptional regulator